MTLQVVGKISMQAAICIKCGCNIQMWVFSNNIKCQNCGAMFVLSKSELKDQFVEYEYDFVQFKCMHSNINGGCDNECPAPGMYCKEHLSDKYFEEANNSISYCEQRLGQTKDKLERMKESKKLWLIQEVSGIDDEQDDSVQTGKDRQDTRMGHLGGGKR